MAEIVLTLQGEEMMHFPIQQGMVRIGRGMPNDISFPETERQVSRFHCLLEKRKDSYKLRDLTGHGVPVNGVSQVEADLADGDVLSVGNWELLFRQESAGLSQPTLVVHDADTLSMNKEAEASLTARIVFEVGGRSRAVSLESGALQIGSSEQAEVCIDEPFVSSFHCRIFPKGGRYHIRDLQSTNGVWVNGIKVVEAELPDSAEIFLGKFPVKFEALRSEEVAQSFPGFAGMVSQDAAMQGLFSMVQRMADNDLPVLIQGESGVGKELVARALHEQSSRCAHPFVAINCGSISRDLIESALFGHEKGAFTGAVQARMGAFEEAGEGTLFLDEIGDMPLAQQVALLRVLEGGSYRKVGGSKELVSRARVVTATHRQLNQSVAENTFREDLFYRISVLPLRIPALRERPGDISLLADYFLHLFAAKRKLSFSEPAYAKMRAHFWPGNVRELRNSIQRALVMVEGALIQPEDLVMQSVLVEGRTSGASEPAKASLQDAEKQTILQALEVSQWVVSDTAKVLGISRSSLYNKMKKLNIQHRK